MKRLVSLTVLAFIVSACGQLTGGTNSPYSVATPFDGVKLVSSSITNAEDPLSMTQATYPISSTSRLLIRLEDFLAKVDEVSLASGNNVSTIITVENVADAAAAHAHFQVCPISKNWMMLATWRRAYPMGSDGTWNQAGGDYDASACIAVTSVSGSDINFTVTPWFVNYVRGRSLNYGLVMISDSATAIVIKGDNDAYSSPRIEWTTNH
jgi:hypothetical protein